MFEFQGLKIRWLGHDGFVISNSKTVIIDPFKAAAISAKADILLISHEHFDHLSLEDIRELVTERTTLIAASGCREALSKIKFKETIFMKPGDKMNIGDITVEAVPAYNVNKFREPGKPFHPKDEGKLGYIVQLGAVRVYHAGDTDFIPEMKRLKADVALLPVSGTYVMTANEAAMAASAIAPKVAIPMHYGAIVGSERDAQEFKRLASCSVEILEA